MNAPSNSTADADGNILVRPGDRMPLVPEHNGRLILDYQLNEHLDIGANLIVVSGSYLHGNENNSNVSGATDAATGAYISPDGTGWIPRLHGAESQWHLPIQRAAGGLRAHDECSNRDYSTAGFLTQNVYTPNGTFMPDPDEWTNENNVVRVAKRSADDLGR